MLPASCRSTQKPTKSPYRAQRDMARMLDSFYDEDAKHAMDTSVDSDREKREADELPDYESPEPETDTKFKLEENGEIVEPKPQWTAINTPIKAETYTNAYENDTGSTAGKTTDSAQSSNTTQASTNASGRPKARRLRLIAPRRDKAASSNSTIPAPHAVINDVLTNSAVVDNAVTEDAITDNAAADNTVTDDAATSDAGTTDAASTVDTNNAVTNGAVTNGAVTNGAVTNDAGTTDAAPAIVTNDAASDASSLNNTVQPHKDRQTSKKKDVLTPSGHGTSVEKPQQAPLNKPWPCGNRDCCTGMTWYPRDGPETSYGRKTTSNFFGRNKSETKRIHPDVWHYSCRKCYQRATYVVRLRLSNDQCKWYIENIETQLKRIKIWRPQAQFTVQLYKGARDRLARYYKEQTKNGMSKEAAKQAVRKSPEVNAKGLTKPLSLDYDFPIELLEYLDDNFCNDNQDFDDLKVIVRWVKELTRTNQITSMPPMEFLINETVPGETVNDPTGNKNYEQWAALEDSKLAAKAADINEKADIDEEEDSVDGADDIMASIEANGKATADEASEPGTPEPLHTSPFRLSPTRPGETVMPMSSTFGATPGSGLVRDRKRKRKRSDAADADADVVDSPPPKKQQRSTAQRSASW